MKSARLVLASLLTACAAAPPPSPAAPPPAETPRVAPPPLSLLEPPVTPDAPFRDQPPPPAGTVAWSPPRIDSFALSNGTRVLFVERHDLPIVAVRVVSGAGAGDLPAERPGAVAFMGTMLEQGAGKLGALELSDAFEALGADHGTSCEWDACVARVKVLASRLQPALDLLADVVLRPTFAPAEFERVRKRWLSGLSQEKTSPAAMEQNAIAAVVFGRAHPYGHSLSGEPSDIAGLQRADVERAWRRAFQPRSATIVVAGDVAARELQPALEARFGSWRGGAAERVAVRPPPAPASNHAVTLVDVAGAAQSQVFLVGAGAPFGSPDRIAIGVMNAILGGMFSSRINLDLREAHAYTYGARSRFAMRHGVGPFSAGGAMVTAHTADAVHALEDEIARMRVDPVTDEELADAKENAKLALPARFEAVDGVAGALQELAVYGLPLDEYATRAARIDAVTAADVRRVADQWLRPQAMYLVVTGDRAKIEAQLAPFGRLEGRDAFGDLLQ